MTLRASITALALCGGCSGGAFSGQGDGGLPDQAEASAYEMVDSGATQDGGAPRLDARPPWDARSDAGGTSAGGAGGFAPTAGTGGDALGGSGGAVAGSGGSLATCTNGETRCVGTQPEVCASGEWFASGAKCSGATPMCLGGRCVECTPGTEQCLTVSQSGSCGNDGFWQRESCAGTTPQCLGGECVACESGAREYCPPCSQQDAQGTCCMPDGSCGCWIYDPSAPAVGCVPN